MAGFLNIREQDGASTKVYTVNKGAFYAASTDVREGDALFRQASDGDAAHLLLPPGKSAYVRTNVIAEIDDDSMCIVFSVFPEDIRLLSSVFFREHLTGGLVLKYLNNTPSDVKIYDGEICGYLNCVPRSSAPDNVEVFDLREISSEEAPPADTADFSGVSGALVFLSAAALDPIKGT